ncbi:N-6 DNA methylase [Pseudomonas aeruginosa]|uniref:N-6 DNA methylase n=1 Tax=Pseudomonas aeruginosa TaxID=287 RepID=UPI0030F20391
MALFMEFRGRHHLWQVFADAVAFMAFAISNSCDMRMRDERERRYMEGIGRYSSAEQARFPQIFQALCETLEAKPGDILGKIFEELGLANADRGQFFTPFHIGQLMAQLLIDPVKQASEIKRWGFITLNEPACGAGAMVIAFAQSMFERGINYQQHLHVTAQDIDERAVHMAYVQLSLLGVPAVVIHGEHAAGGEPWGMVDADARGGEMARAPQPSPCIRSNDLAAVRHPAGRQ